MLKLGDSNLVINPWSRSRLFKDNRLHISPYSEEFLNDGRTSSQPGCHTPKTMNANLAKPDVVAAPAGVIDEPLYFPSNGSQLFGWLHWHSGQSSDTGLVICKPFGYEGLCAHMSLRVFAQAAAARGIPTLSFDYAGTGDSMDIDPSADQIEVWCGDVVSAVAKLRQRTRVKRVCLLGFRLGALLATLVAHRTGIQALVLAAPILNGRSYLRELRTAQAMASAARRSHQAAPAKKENPTVGDGSMEVGGYPLSAKTVARLEAIDLPSLGAPPVSSLLVIDRKGVAPSRAWTESVSAGGIQAEYVSLSGFVEMMMTAPQWTKVPTDIVACFEEWLTRFSGPTSSSMPRPAGELTASRPSAEVLHLPGDENAGVAALDERPIRFGPEGSLFGIVTESHRKEPPKGAVVLLNAGADQHACIGRMYVTLARHWAKAGYCVLRMDLGGLGDSYPRPGLPLNDVFPPTAIEDITTAAELMRDLYGAQDITLAGLCSGAYHSLRAAVAGVSVSRILMINPQNYFWKTGRTIDELRVAEVVNNVSVYRQRIWSAAAWKRLFSGKVSPVRILLVYVYRVDMALKACFRKVAKALRIRVAEDLGRELEDVTARGVALSFFFASGEPGLELLRIQAGSSLRRLGDRCKVHVIDGADHTFSHSAARAVLQPMLSAALFSGSTAAASQSGRLAT
jgi:alpha-beta hydrolase superfamily lysophospholipase